MEWLERFPSVVKGPVCYIVAIWSVRNGDWDPQRVCSPLEPLGWPLGTWAWRRLPLGPRLCLDNRHIWKNAKFHLKSMFFVTVSSKRLVQKLQILRKTSTLLMIVNQAKCTKILLCPLTIIQKFIQITHWEPIAQ